MMTETTGRLTLPLLQAGQAQKEMAHNEALAALDVLVQATVVTVGANTPPVDPVVGQCWVLGSSPVGAWSGQTCALAGWTSGGWRFAAPFVGLTVWNVGAGNEARWTGSTWETGVIRGAALQLGGNQVVGPRRSAIADPAGGVTIDTEARATLALILTTLRGHGLIAG